MKKIMISNLILFIVCSLILIIMAINKWINTGGSELSTIAGWSCAIIWCINATFFKIKN